MADTRFGHRRELPLRPNSLGWKIRTWSLRKNHNPNPEFAMSIDKSLKRKAGGNRNRCVLTRVERVMKLKEDGKWNDNISPFGLAKTRVQKRVIRCQTSFLVTR